MISTLLALVSVFAMLALLAVGGMVSVLPELQRQVTEVHHWMPAREFAALFALAQASPGPNMLVSTLVGWHVAGLAGALTATVAICLPPCVLTYFTATLWQHFRHARWRRIAQAALTPVAVGIILAAAFVLSRSTTDNWGNLAVTLVTTIVLVTTRLNPLYLLGGAALLGVAGLV